MNELATRHARGEDSEIDFLDLFFNIRQHLGVLIAVFILGAVLAAAGSYFFIEPTYKASSEIYIVSASSENVSLTDLQIGSTLTEDYVSLLSSRTVAEAILRDLDLDCSTDDVQNMVDITNPSETRLLKITVKSHDPELSARIANEMAEIATEWLPSVMECDAPHIVEEAVVPLKKAGPNVPLFAAFGAVVAFGIALLFFYVQYVLNDTIRSSEDLECYFGMTPLASIPEDFSEPNRGLSKDSNDSRSKKKSKGVSKR